MTDNKTKTKTRTATGVLSSTALALYDFDDLDSPKKVSLRGKKKGARACFVAGNERFKTRYEPPKVRGKPPNIRHEWFETGCSPSPPCSHMRVAFVHTCV